MANQYPRRAVPKERHSQKNRTRKALVAAAGELMQAGHAPTITEVADSAGISRATAYRYFPTQAMLWAEIALFASGGPVFPAEASSAPLPEAVGQLVSRVGGWALANEQPLRTLLRLSLDPSTGVHRPGHRVEWIKDVLAPARNRLDKKTYERLSKALTLLIGIDPIVVMKDIAHSPHEQILDVLNWTARMLVEAAINSTPRDARAATGKRGT